MLVTQSLAPGNSLLLIMDRDATGIPESMGSKPVVATPSCIAVGTRSEADGNTSITLTDENCTASGNRQRGLRKAFSGVLETPKRELVVRTVLLQTVAKLPVAEAQTRIEVFTNHESEPDNICIVAQSRDEQHT
jgi:hypothetical protein